MYLGPMSSRAGTQIKKYLVLRKNVQTRAEQRFVVFSFKGMQSSEQIDKPALPNPTFPPTTRVNDRAVLALHSAKNLSVVANRHLLKFASSTYSSKKRYSYIKFK